MPDNGLYTASIDIDKKAVTSYGKRIMPDSEQTGIAEVITEDISIGERFLFPIKYLISNNMK